MHSNCHSDTASDDKKISQKYIWKDVEESDHGLI
jgi:hypothetical protein